MIKRIGLLIAAATLLVVMTASFAWAQGTTPNPCPPGEFLDPVTGTCVEAKEGKRLPKTGGEPIGSVLLPAATLLVGGGLLGYAILRRR